MVIGSSMWEPSGWGWGDKRPFSSHFQDSVFSSRKWVMLMMAPVAGTGHRVQWGQGDRL